MDNNQDPLSSSGELQRDPPGIERVRRHILTALHVGRLRPGEQVPSVRRLAQLIGLNRKTVHRAYRTLADEGLLETRSGCGTFVAEARNSSAAGDAAVGRLVQAVNRCRSEAAALGVSPDLFAVYLSNYLSDGLRGLPVAVAECNREQIDAVSWHLHSTLGLVCHPVLLQDLAKEPEAALDERWGIVTTDCHRIEVEAAVAELGKPVYRVALDEEFPRKLAESARSAPGWMVIADPVFAGVFRRLLAHLSVPEETIGRVDIVQEGEARAAFRRSNGHRWVWVSPLVDRQVTPIVPPHLHRVHGRWSVAATSFERLRARLSFDVAVRSS